MFVDISRTISPDSVVFPGDDPMRFVQVVKIGSDSAYAKFAIEGFTGHRMSHVDMPCHLFVGGKTLDDYKVDDFVFDAVVHPVNGDVIDASVVDAMGDVRGKAALFKTRCSAIGDTEPFAEDFVYITKDGAERLLKAGITAVGIDYLSVDSLDTEVAHKTLISNSILVFEGLQFRDAEPGQYKMFAFPLKVQGADGSCVRAVLQTCGDK